MNATCRQEGLGMVRAACWCILTSAPAAAVRQLLEEQTPAAVVLACSDSRCPPEMVFDQGLGDLYCLRRAGTALHPTLNFCMQQLQSRWCIRHGKAPSLICCMLLPSWAC
jgi:hypothetical protein